MKFFKVVITLVILFSVSFINAQSIYVSKSGNDANTGTASKPFKTIAKASSVAKPGSVIVISEGTYEETIKPARSGTAGNPIIYTSKQGDKVIVSAMQALSGWKKDNGAIYKIKVSWDLGQENFVMNGSTAMDLARWPNNIDGKPFTLNSLRNDGGSSGNTINNSYITSSKIPGINWTGGAAFFYGDKPGAGWIAWKAFITSSSSGKVNFNLDKNPSWIRTFHAPADKGDFYLEGVKGALDYQNEWWFNSKTKELFVQLPGGIIPSDQVVQMRKRSTTIDLNDRSYIEIRNLAVFGGAIELKRNSNNNKLYGVSSFYGNHTQGVFKGFNAGKPSLEVNGKNNSVEKCEIGYSAATGVRMAGSFNELKNNYIHDFNYLGSYDAPLVARGGTDNKIIGNTIFNGGRDGINYNGNRCEIAYNDVYKSNLIADDCGTFYTTGGPQNTELHHNWFHDAQSRGEKKKAAGIYLDNDSQAFSVHHNVVWNVEWTGVQINWSGKNIDIFNNTLVKTKGGAMGAWHKAGTAFSNVKVWNNIADIKNVDDPSTQEDEGTFERDADKQNNIITKTGFSNYVNNDFSLTSSSLAVNKGRKITGITDGFKGVLPDVGAYEYGAEKWVAGVNWSPLSGPTGQGCYGLPGETCGETKEFVEFVNPLATITAKKSYDFKIKYNAETKREIVVEFWSSTTWLGQKKVAVNSGTGMVNITVDLSTIPVLGAGYVYKVHIRPLNSTWEQAINRDQVNDVLISDLNKQIIADGTYFIESPENNQRLLSNVSKGHNVVMINPGNFSDQKWVVKHVSNNVYTIKNIRTNRYLEVPKAICSDGTNVATWTNFGDNHKKWKIVENGIGIYGLKPLHCLDKALDRAGGRVDTNVQIWGYSKSNNNQKWKITSPIARRESPLSKVDFEVFPIPFKDQVTLKSKESLKNSIIKVLNINGKVIYSIAIKDDILIKTIKLNQFESGVYFIQLITANNVQNKQIIK